MRYHSEALAQWILRRGERDVEVRWHPDDISRVNVYAGGQNFEVRAVHDGFQGVSARQWLAATRELRSTHAARTTRDRESVLEAVSAIKARSTAATKLAGLLVDEWSPERIRREEQRLFTGFSISGEKQAPVRETDGLGRSIPEQEGPSAPSTAQPSAPSGLARDVAATGPTEQKAPTTWTITE